MGGRGRAFLENKIIGLEGARCIDNHGWGNSAVKDSHVACTPSGWLTDALLVWLPSPGTAAVWCL